eukprot:TRINITY_DN3521_c0_g1_i1.p1 TRINITY_DN3521_c0_g1~~TRINITY_DN3521_c0_g1_i1.p1  ORF type:complete len:287 (+),score=57.96 TRINITY_DN3521_c0_g1_i1:68-928(+)
MAMGNQEAPTGEERTNADNYRLYAKGIMLGQRATGEGPKPLLPGPRQLPFDIHYYRITDDHPDLIPGTNRRFRRAAFCAAVRPECLVLNLRNLGEVLLDLNLCREWVRAELGVNPQRRSGSAQRLLGVVQTTFTWVANAWGGVVLRTKDGNEVSPEEHRATRDELRAEFLIACFYELLVEAIREVSSVPRKVERWQKHRSCPGDCAVKEDALLARLLRRQGAAPRVPLAVGAAEEREREDEEAKLVAGSAALRIWRSSCAQDAAPSKFGEVPLFLNCWVGNGVACN